MSNMTGDIGYQVTDEDVAAVIHWLEINDPENANEIVAREMLIGARDMWRGMGRVYIDLLYNAREDYKKKDD